jgi:enamine deaminase RidA (YjgF/YER057c/UK114 family)
MKIERIETGARMSKVVIHGDTVYLAGFTANKALAGGVAEQTAEILSIIDGYLQRLAPTSPSYCAPPSGSLTSAPWTT